MNLVTQPEDSTLCGQCCVAMIAGLPLREVRRAFAKWGRTHGPDLVEALFRLGIPARRSGRLNKNGSLPPRCIIAVSRQAKGKATHWMVRWDGHVYDPNGAIDPQDYFRVTSYLEIAGA